MFTAGYGPLWAKRRSPPVLATVLQTITFDELANGTVVNTQYNQYGFTGFTGWSWNNYSTPLTDYPVVGYVGNPSNPLTLRANPPPPSGLLKWIESGGNGNAIDLNFFNQSIYSVKSVYFDMAQSSTSAQIDILDRYGNFIFTPFYWFGSGFTFLWNNVGGEFGNIETLRIRGDSGLMFMIGNIRIEYYYYV